MERCVQSTEKKSPQIKYCPLIVYCNQWAKKYIQFIDKQIEDKKTSEQNIKLKQPQWTSNSRQDLHSSKHMAEH